MVGSVLSPFLQHWFIAQGANADTLYSTMTQSVAFNVIGLSAGVLGNVVGGYAAAYLAPAGPVVHASVAAALSMVIAAVLYLGVFPAPYPVWAQVTGFALAIPAFIYGAFRFARHKSSDEEV
jgi:hypothetical protein